MKTGNYLIKWKYRDSIKEGETETLCFIQRNNTQISLGIAICSINDQFSKDKGRKISLLRAMQNADIKKEDRVPIWETYRTSMTKEPRW